jgi:hypothetical protein
MEEGQLRAAGAGWRDHGATAPVEATLEIKAVKDGAGLDECH